MKIVFLDTDSIGSIDLAPIANLGELVVYNDTTQAEIAERTKDADVVITNKIKITAEMMANMPKTRLLCIAATGMNNVDIAYAEKIKLPVKNVADYSTNSVTQVTFALLLSLINQVHYYDTYVKNGSYSKNTLFTHHERSFHEIANKTWGIIGMGNIGKRVAEVAKAFGAEIIYVSTSNNNNITNYKRVTLKELLQTSDVVSIHCPLNQSTRNLLGETELRSMKSSAFLVNTARGKIVDEIALAKAIDEGWISGAALDVFAQEPINKDNPLLHLKNAERVILTPHVGWAAVESRQRLVEKIAKNITDYFG